MKVREAVRLIEREGWLLVRIQGKCRQYRPPSRRGRLTLEGGMNDELAPGAIDRILKEAGFG